MAPSEPVPLLSLVTLLFLPCLYADLIKLDCKDENIGMYGQNSLINCVVKGNSDVKIIIVLWKKSEKLLFSYFGEKVHSLEPGFEFAEPNWNQNNMNVSLLVNDTKMAHAGQYECEVVTDSGEDKKEPSLEVRASYSKPAMSSLPEMNIEEGTKVTIFCNVSGGYPAGSIQWFDQYQTNWTKSSETAVMVEKDKRVTLISKLTVIRADSTLSYKCVLYESNGIQQEVKYELPFVSRNQPPEKNMQTKNTVAITAVIVILGSLACGVLVLMLLQRRRSSHKAQYMEPCEINAEDPISQLKTDIASS